MGVVRTQGARRADLQQRGWLLRALVVVSVLAGLFAMHGLTSAHAPSMASMASATTDLTAVHMLDAMPVDAMAISTTAVSVHDMPTVIATSGIQDMGSMGAMCFALLTALVLLLAVRRFRTHLDDGQTDLQQVSRIRWQATAFGPAPPDLAVLSVLRT